MMMKTMRMAQKIFFKKYLAAISLVYRQPIICLNLKPWKRNFDASYPSSPSEGQSMSCKTLDNSITLVLSNITFLLPWWAALFTPVFTNRIAPPAVRCLSLKRSVSLWWAIPFFSNQLLHYPAIVAFSSVCRRTLCTVPHQNASVEPAVLIWYKSVFVQLWSSPTINHTCDEIGVTDVQSRAEAVVAKAKEIVSLDAEVDPTR